MNTIKIEELAAYLAHGLKIQVDGLDKVEELLGLEKEFEGEKWFGFFEEFCSVEIDRIKPLVLPLSEAVKPSLIENFNFGTKQECIDWILSGNAPYCVMKDLFAKHGDVFNWIELGIGVNKLEVEG